MYWYCYVDLVYIDFEEGCVNFIVEWLDHSKTLREQGVNEDITLILRRKFFFSDQNVDQRDPVQLNLLYVQVY